ncbi:MAG: protein kinase [Eubacterium sp.]|nr:protein kinase [Eubacterium sp.]
MQKPVGAGGFGITYKAYDRMKNQPCCIKELFPRDTVYRVQNSMSLAPLSADKKGMMEHCIQRFGEEAQVLQKLNSVKSVVDIYDFFYENETCYFVMEFLDGMNLKSAMKKMGGKLEAALVWDVAEQAGNALVQVHRMGIFHRDISPDNIFITRQGRIKIIDFGNAKHLVKQYGEIHSVVLKKGYSPIEQYSSKGVQGTYTDVYAFAFTLYHALTGIKPPDVFDRQSKDYTKLVELGFQQNISDVFDRALIINAKQRTQTVGQFLAELLPLVRRVNKNEVTPGTTSVSVKTGSGAGKGKTGGGTADGKSDILSKDLGPSDKTSRTEKPSDKPNTPRTPGTIMPTAKNPAIEVVVNNRSIGQFKIRPNVNISIGRTPTKSSFVVDEIHISGLHCEIRYATVDRKFYIVDRSTNGTYINGVRIKPGGYVAAKAKDKIALGSTNAILILKEV